MTDHDIIWWVHIVDADGNPTATILTADEEFGLDVVEHPETGEPMRATHDEEHEAALLARLRAAGVEIDGTPEMTRMYLSDLHPWFHDEANLDRVIPLAEMQEHGLA